MIKSISNTLNDVDENSTEQEVDFLANNLKVVTGVLKTQDILDLANLREIGNLEITSIADNHFLVYDNASSKWINKQPANALLSLGVTATAAELNYSDITTLGTLEASKVLTADSSGHVTVPDNSKIQIGAGLDMTLYHDGTDSYLTNSTGVLKIATETSGIAVQIGHGTSEVTVNDNLTVAGNLTVNGTTTTVNSTVTTLDDPIITLGGDTAPGSDDNKDRGVEFRWHNGSAAKVGFFGYDDSASKFTFIPDATNSSEVFSGSAGDVAFGAGEFSDSVVLKNGKSLRLSELDSNGTHTVSIKAPDSVTTDVTLVLPDGTGTSGQALTTDGSGNLSWAAVSGFKTYSTKTANFTAAVNNHYSVSTAGGAITSSLPQISSTSAGESVVIKFRAGTNSLTISPYSGDTIEGLPNLILTDSQAPGQSVTLVSNGSSAWEII